MLKMTKTKLQVALDVLSIKDAKQIAEEVIDFVDIIEVGTPLIKKEGIKAVREIKKAFGKYGKLILADMKTMDVGYLEVKIAAKAGADIITIMGAAADKTIEEAIKAKKELGVEIMIDLMNVQNIIERIKWLNTKDVDYILLHIGKDQQIQGISPLEFLKEYRNYIEKSLAVAGGINDKSLIDILEYKPEIVIVGGFIIKSNCPREAAKKLKDIIDKYYKEWV